MSLSVLAITAGRPGVSPRGCSRLPPWLMPCVMPPPAPDCESEHRGSPCVLDHSAVIGRWGPIFVELAEIHEISPPELKAAFMGPGADGQHPNRVSYVVDDPEAERARLEAVGLRRFWRARQGPMELSFYDATDLFGQAVEVHHNSDAFRALFSVVEQAASAWDGSDPLREFPTR